MPPAYYYHLKFELYAFSSTASLNQEKEGLEIGVWIPSPGSNIFQTGDWPKHRSVQVWPRNSPRKREFHEKVTGCSKEAEIAKINICSGSSAQDNIETKRHISGSKLGADIGHISGLAGSIIDCGPGRAGKGADIVAKGSKIIGTRATGSPGPKLKYARENLQNAERDWRFGRVAIEGYEFETMEDGFTDDSANGSASKEAGQSSAMSLGDSFMTDLISEDDQKGRVTKAQFVPIVGNNTQVGWGLVHLFRDGVETLSFKPGQDMVGEGEDCTTLCVPAVPSYLSPSDFLGWVGEKTREQISHFRMVMTGGLMRYLVLMKFRSGMAARAWKEEWDGRAFNSMEPEICRVVFIKSITFCSPPSTNFPALTHDSLTSSTTSAATASLIELPTCPVCLERMDDTTGLLTILCQHVFHCSCLLKWKDSSCPVCRHTNPPSVDGPREIPFGSGEASICSTCNCADDLWICLICGNVGCGRYKGGHAKEHWKESAHCFALEIETQHVWDYAGDIWVHRLIRDKGENSKVIELPSQTPASRQSNDNIVSNGSPTVPRSKLDVLSIEYTHLVTSQLESQRVYFEDLMKKAAAETAAAEAAAAMATRSASTALAQLQALELDHATLKSELAAQSRDLERERCKALKSTEMAREFSKNLVEERRVSEGLMQRIEHLNSNIANIAKDHEALKADNRELSETNRDLLFCLSAGEKVREMEASGESGLASGELEAGVVCLPPPPEGKSKGKGKGKGRAKGN